MSSVLIDMSFSCCRMSRETKKTCNLSKIKIINLQKKIIRLTTNFPQQKSDNNVFKNLRENKLSNQGSIPAKQKFKGEGKIMFL